VHPVATMTAGDPAGATLCHGMRRATGERLFRLPDAQGDPVGALAGRSGHRAHTPGGVGGRVSARGAVRRGEERQGPRGALRATYERGCCRRSVEGVAGRRDGAPAVISRSAAEPGMPARWPPRVTSRPRIRLVRICHQRGAAEERPRPGGPSSAGRSRQDYTGQVSASRTR